MDGPITEPEAPASTLYSVIDRRRSIRSYRANAVPDTVLARLLGAASSAPSPHNRQPWRFVLLRPAAASALACAMGERLAADRRRDGDAAELIARDVARSEARLTGAPVLLLVCVTLEEMDAYPDAKRREAEFLMAVQGTAMAAQNLMLAASAEGLATCWMCAPLFCPETVREMLALPAAWQPQGLITLGYPATAGRLRPRKPLGEILFERGAP
jgi:coenzyme F420-0:L-glutamate ligase / coenzyme F420-1:gamma-L-glutamate ligase